MSAPRPAAARGAPPLLIDALEGLPDDGLLRHFITRNNVSYPRLPDPTPEQLQHADAVLDNRFTYTGETYRFDPGFSWKPNPSTDKEWQIAFHKHYFLIDLAQAYRHTGDKAYLLRWRDLLNSWMAEMGSGYITLSDAQVEAKRMESWVTSFMLLAGTDWHRSISGGFLRRFLTRISGETDYIGDHLKPVRNHRTFQLYAIYLVGVIFPELRRQPDFLSLGLAKLSQNLLTDFHADGVHIELSTHYHQLVAETGIRMLELARLNQLPVSAELVERLRRALRFSLYLQWPDGDIPLINDSDTGNHRDLLELGSLYLGDPELLWGATLGTEGRPPRDASRAFTEAGYFVLSDGWGTDPASYSRRQQVFYDCGKLGEGSHSHYDLFNFCYYAGGAPAIVDPGRYTYCGEPDADGINWRHYFKGTAAHNTVTVDGRDQTLYLSRTKHGPEVVLEHRDWLLGQRSDWVFGRASSPNYRPSHERLLVYMGHQYLFILDRLDPNDAEPHHYQLNFHLPAGTDVLQSREDDHHRFQSDRCEVRIIGTSGLDAAVRPGWVSRHYGIKQAAPIISAEQKRSGRMMFASLVSPRADGEFAVTSFDRRPLGSSGICFSATVTDGANRHTDHFLLLGDPTATVRLGDLEFCGRFLAYRCDEAGQTLFAAAMDATLLQVANRPALTFPHMSNFEWAP